MILLVLFVSILSQIPLSSAIHTPTIEWTINLEEKQQTNGFHVIHSNDGTYLVAGTIGSPLTNQQCLLLKIDQNGTIIWQKQYKENTINEAYALLQTQDDGYLLVGSTGPNFFTSQILLIKTDTNGIIEWNKTYQITKGENKAVTIIQTEDDGYALAGWIRPQGSTDYNFILIKTDNEGNELWNRSYDSGLADKAWSLIQTNDGGFALVGSRISPSYEDSDSWLVKTDANGIMEWNHTYGGLNQDNARVIIQTNDNGFIFAGDTASFGSGATDGWLVKTNADGIIEWNHTYGGSGFDIFRSILQTPDGGYLLGGYSETLLYEDAFLVKTTKEGYIQWEQNYSFPDDSLVQSMLLTSDNKIVLTGSLQIFSEKNQLFLMKTSNISFETTNLYPIATAGNDTTGICGETIAFNGTGYDPDGNIIRYRWDFDADDVYDWSSTTNATTTYTYNHPGVYEARLEVTDQNNSTATDIRTITILPVSSQNILNDLSPGAWFCLESIVFLSIILLSIILFVTYQKQRIVNLTKKIIKKQPNIWWYYLTITIFILIACKLLLCAVVQNPWIYYDEPAYGVISHQISQGNFSLVGITSFTHSYPSAYSYFIAPAHLLGGNMDIIYHGMLLINCILSSLLIIPIFFVMQRFVSKKNSLFTAILCATLPVVLIQNYLLMSENLFYLIFFCSCLLLIKTVENDSKKNKRFYTYLFLFIGTLLLLVFIKALAVCMIAAVAIFAIYYIVVKKRSRKLILTLGITLFLLVISSYLLIQNNPDDLLGYPVSSYIATALSIFSTPSNILHFLEILGNEINYYNLMSYVVFLVFTLFLVIRWRSLSTTIKKPLITFLLFTGFTNIFLILLTILHIFYSPYTIYTRYVSTGLPAIIMLGVVGMSLFKKTSNKQPQRSLLEIDLLFTILGLFFIFAFPKDYYKPANTLDFFWINTLTDTSINGFNGFSILQLIIGIIIISLNILLFYRLIQNKLSIQHLRYFNHTIVRILPIIISFLLFIPSAQFMIQQNDIIINQSSFSEPARWLAQQNLNITTIILEDYESAYAETSLSLQEWTAFYASLQFWLPSTTIKVETRNQLKTMILSGTIDADYIISTHDLTHYYPISPLKNQRPYLIWNIYKIK